MNISRRVRLHSARGVKSRVEGHSGSYFPAVVRWLTTTLPPFRNTFKNRLLDSSRREEPALRCARIDKWGCILAPCPSTLSFPSFLPPPDALKSQNVRWRLKVKAGLFPARPNLESVGLRRSAEKTGDETAWARGTRYWKRRDERSRSCDIDRFGKSLWGIFSFWCVWGIKENTWYFLLFVIFADTIGSWYSF